MKTVYAFGNVVVVVVATVVDAGDPVVVVAVADLLDVVTWLLLDVASRFRNISTIDFNWKCSASTISAS